MTGLGLLNSVDTSSVFKSYKRHLCGMHHIPAIVSREKAGVFALRPADEPLR